MGGNLSRALRASWDEVRRDFFPRWDREGRWRLRTDRSVGKSHGRCDLERR
jgi:hypothetical protein